MLCCVTRLVGTGLNITSLKDWLILIKTKALTKLSSLVRHCFQSMQGRNDNSIKYFTMTPSVMLHVRKKNNLIILLFSFLRINSTTFLLLKRPIHTQLISVCNRQISVINKNSHKQLNSPIVSNVCMRMLIETLVLNHYKIFMNQSYK